MPNLPNQVYYNNKGNKQFKFERGYPDTIHVNMVTFDLPNRDKRIARGRPMKWLKWCARIQIKKKCL